MKMSIEWHRECLNNNRSYDEREITLAQETMDRALAGAQRTAFYEEQIEAAEAKGKDGFDADRFMRKVGLDIDSLMRKVQKK